MSAKRLKTVVVAVVFPASVWAGSVRIGPLPAMGAFLDPANGVWAVARSAELPDSAAIAIPGLESTVRVVYDDRAVPHIFGDHIGDVVAALGFVVARDRLFQLDLQTRSTAGTLSAVLGELAIQVDRQARRLDLAGSAERNFADLPAAGPDRELLNAFATGVNTWIDQLAPRDYPFEYKLIGASPARWEPVYSIYLMKRMGWNLAYVNLESRKLAAAARVGWEAADALFPIHAPIQEPIQPAGQTEPHADPVDLPPAGPPDEDAKNLLALGQPFGLFEPDHAGAEDVVGSNNWAVGPTRTRDGHAILAGDPHLGLSLPSVWYEVHLVVRDSLDVYGVTLPGAPGIIIGFNRDVAWSFTNTGADVMDFYREEVDDVDAPRRYRLDGEWRDLRVRIEEYRGRGGSLIATDTIYHTHRGPMTRHGAEWWSLRWTVLEDQGEQQAFRSVMGAHNVDEWLEAMTSFLAPAQNGIVADRGGSIAIRAHGRYPVRPGDGRGDLLQDGTLEANDWSGDWPVSRYPFSIDPGQGFLASANQQPIDPRSEPGYLGADWPAPWRAMRINTLLRQHDSLTPDDLRAFQTDPGSARADVFAPMFVDAARRRLAEQDDPPLAKALARLEAWPRTYGTENVGAVLFERAMQQLGFLTWDEFETVDDGDLPYVRPGSDMLAVLLNDGDNVWWDRRDTEERETGDQILVEALQHAFERLAAELGEDEEAWRWRNHRASNVWHLLQIQALSATGIPVQGGPSTLAPSSGTGRHGASWRMVVELGPEVRAWVTYPGGQSGNPVSTRYADRIAQWSEGRLDEILFPRRPEDISTDRVRSFLRLEESRR